MDGHKPAGDGLRQPIRWNKWRIGWNKWISRLETDP